MTESIQIHQFESPEILPAGHGTGGARVKNESAPNIPPPESFEFIEKYFSLGGEPVHVVLQPKVEIRLKSERNGGNPAEKYKKVTIGYEILLRNKNGRAPVENIEKAEEDGTIHACTLEVLSEAVRAIKRGVGPIACNVSANELTEEFVREMEEFRKNLLSEGVDPDGLEIEVVERAEIIPDKHIPILKKLSERGVRISLDDFGAEHGRNDTDTVRALQKAGIPLTVKLDKKLADKNSVVKIARELKKEFGKGVSLVAEGVESNRQVEQLAKMGVAIQSFKFSGKPVELSQVFYEQSPTYH